MPDWVAPLLSGGALVAVALMIWQAGRFYQRAETHFDSEGEAHKRIDKHLEKLNGGVDDIKEACAEHDRRLDTHEIRIGQLEAEE